MEMTPINAVLIAEGEIDTDQDTQIEAWQYLVDTGLAWSLQGSFGRMAQELIDVLNATIIDNILERHEFSGPGGHGHRLSAP